MEREPRTTTPDLDASDDTSGATDSSEGATKRVAATEELRRRGRQALLTKIMDEDTEILRILAQ